MDVWMDGYMGECMDERYNRSTADAGLVDTGL